MGVGQEKSFDTRQFPSNNLLTNVSRYIFSNQFIPFNRSRGGSKDIIHRIVTVTKKKSHIQLVRVPGIKWLARWLETYSSVGFQRGINHFGCQVRNISLFASIDRFRYSRFNQVHNKSGKSIQALTMHGFPPIHFGWSSKCWLAIITNYHSLSERPHRWMDRHRITTFMKHQDPSQIRNRTRLN